MPTATNPLQKVIDGLQSVIAKQAVDPKDPEIEPMLIELGEMLAQITDSIIGTGDDDNRG